MTSQTTATWDGKSKGSITGQLIFFKLISLFGLWPAYFLLAFVSLYYALTNKKTAFAIRIFRTHTGNKTSFFHIYKHVYSFGMCLIDRYAFLIGKKSLFSFESIHEDVIMSMLDKKKGVILLGAHIGNWEIAGNLLSEHLTTTINIVMMDTEKEAMRDIYKSASDNRKINIIPINADPLDFMLKVRNALGNNEIVCMHGDRLVGQKGQSHDFFDAPVEFPMGPFLIAAATQTPVIPVVVTKKGFSSYTFKAFSPIQFDAISRDNRDKYIYTAMERYIGILEQVVKEHPYQWFNFYDFWTSNKNQNS